MRRAHEDSRGKVRVLLQNKPLIIFIIALMCILFGFAAGMGPFLSLFFIVIPIIVLMFYNPTYAFYLFVASLPLYVVPIKALSASIPRVMGIILFTVWAPYVFFTGKFKLMKWDRLFVMMIIFYGWMVLSSTWSLLPEGAYIIMRSTGQLMLSIIIGLTLINKPDKFNHVVIIVLVTCMAAGFRSFGMSMLTTERVVGIEGYDQNEFASMLLAPLMIAFSLYNYQDSKWKMVFYIVVGIGCFMGALSTVSRGFVLSVLSSLVTLYRLEPRKKKMLALLIVLLVAAGPYYIQKYSERIGKERFELSSTAEVPRGRLGIWLIGWEIYKNHPIFGVGLSGFPVAFDEELKKDPTRIGFRQYGRAAHNDYLMIMTELGTIGLMLWLALIIQVFRKGFRTYDILVRTKEDYLAAVSRGAISGFVGLLVASMFLGLYHSKYMWLLLTLFVLLANIARTVRAESDDKAIKRIPEP